MIEAVLFDLDDTLYDQQHWLQPAWTGVAEAAAPYGVDVTAFRDALVAVAAEGSARGKIIDRALARTGATGVPVLPLVEVFLAFEPDSLSPYPGMRESLGELRQAVPIGLVTDGNVEVQRAKIRLLGLEEEFDAIVLSDELGRELRKPHPAPFDAALRALQAVPERTVHVGDRPDKDIRGAAAAGLRAVRVLTGEYRSLPDDQPAWTRAPDAVAAIRKLLPLCDPEARARYLERRQDPINMRSRRLSLQTSTSS